MKKTSVWLAIVMTLAMIAAGCSSGKNSEGTGGDTGRKDAGGSGEKVTISFWILEDHGVYLNPIVEDFQNENPDIGVEVTTYGTDPIKESLKVAAASRTLPDLWFTWGGSLGSFYPENGLTLDLTRVAEEQNWSANFSQSAIDMSTFGGKISGVPFHLNSLGVFYHKSVHEKLGLKEPATFAEFEANLQTMKDNGIVPLAFGGKYGWHLMRLTEQLLEHFAGPELHDKLSGLEASWTDPAVVKTFEKLKEWSEKGYFPKGAVSLDPSEAQQLFYQGQHGYIIEGNWFDSSLSQNGVNPNDIGLFRFPTDRRPVRMSAFVEMFQINGNSDKSRQEAALKLAEYITDVNVVNKYIDSYGAPATLGFQQSSNSPHSKLMSDLASEGTFLISDQALPQEVVQKLFEAQDRVLLNEWTPQQAAEAMQQAIEAYKAK